ncbi:NAD(P)H-hydrate epimerase, partial [Helicobacter canis]|uniref:NAD(P)H-hydrate epimerase n=1 Tax=Helicobacter canis TaxID=29419 RepID=UPI0029436AD3
MRYLYTTTQALDKRALSKYLLSDELLMENAANALLSLIDKLTHKGSVVTIVCGSGDNGADGYALARKLQGSYITRIYEAKEPKSRLCKLQSERAQVAGCEWVKKLLPCDMLVDCLFGSGFAGELSAESMKLLEQMNTCARLNIACDVPSGLDLQGRVGSIAFRADYTLSMGALKVALFSDEAKDLTGKVLVGDLGVSRELFEVQSPFYLLEESDMRLPHRTKQNCHKGSFGHIAVIAGEKAGAAELSALSGLRMGAGLVSVVSRDCALGSHSGDFVDFRATADHQSSSAPKST